MNEVITGQAGRAEQLELNPIRPSDACGIRQYLLTLPGSHPIWSQYMLGLISLRDVPGVPPAYKQYAQAEYEILMLALDPDAKPVPTDRETWRPLTPANYVYQFHGVTQDEAIWMLHALAGVFVGGYLVAEPSGIGGAREAFVGTVERLKFKAQATRPMGGQDV